MTTVITAAAGVRRITATTKLGTGGSPAGVSLFGTTSGLALVTAAMTVSAPGAVPLEGVTYGAGVATGNLTAAVAGAVVLEGVAAGVGASTGNLSTTAPSAVAMAGTTAGVGASAGDLASTAPSAVAMAGSVNGIGVTVGDLLATAPPASADVDSVTIVDSTPLDATNDYGDSTARIGVNGAGWVGKIVMDLQLGSTFDPSKMIHTVDDPGYDAAGSPTTVRREIRGTVILRRQYTVGGASSLKQQSDDGTTVTIYYALEDVIYAGSTLVEVIAETGFYGPLTPGSVTTIVNASDRPYYKPLAAWFNMQHDRATGSGYAIELAAAHAHGMNGRMVAAVQFIATDGASHTAATQTASTTALSSIQTTGNIAEAYKATIPLSALDAGAVCTINAIVYPWIGDSSAVLNLAVDGFAWPTANPQTPLRFLNDKNGTYGGAIAYVRAGAGGTPQVSRTDATARANPYPTLSAASAALAAFNNTNSTPAHNDHSGSTIYLMDDGSGGAVAHTIAAAFNTAAGHCWTEIKPDPLATGAVSLLMDNTRGVPDKFKFFINISHTAGNGFDAGSGGGSRMLAFAGGTITDTMTVPLHYRNGLVYLSNVTMVATAQRNMLAGYANTRTQTALALGVIAEGATGDGNVLPYAMIGCRLKRLALQEITPASMPSNDDQDGMFVMNNWFRDVRSSGTLPSLISNRSWSRGLAVVQNLFEGGVPNATGLRLGGDGTSMACDNVVFAFNSIVGGRINHGYTDVAAAAGVLRRMRMRFNLCNDTWNCKTDTFTTNTTVTGRVLNWEHLHNVGNKGNVVTGGSANNAAPNPDKSWLGPWWPAPTYNVGAGNVTFTDDKSLPIGAGALGGTYSLTGSSNAAYNQVAAGDAMLSFDIAGNPRLNDNTGASGCYERAA